VVGRTGSGKSSLLLALYELIELTSGRVLLDGLDVSTIALSCLRQQFAIIPQDPLLFSGERVPRHPRSIGFPYATTTAESVAFMKTHGAGPSWAYYSPVTYVAFNIYSRQLNIQIDSGFHTLLT
jgi:ABC-type oligopeptide transport system ATPase subunit